MKTSKEMQLKIIDKMRENVESGKPFCQGLEYKNYCGNWIEEDGQVVLDNYEYRLKSETITINGIEIPKPLTEDEMKNLDKDGVYFPCSNPAMYSVESKKYCILNRA